MPRYELSEPSGRFVVARSKISAFGSLLAVIAVLLFGLPPIFWVMWWIGNDLSELRPLMFLIMVLVGIGLGVCGFVALKRAYGMYRQREIVVLDRAGDSVTKDGRTVCALGEVDRVELRCDTHSDSEGGSVDIFKVGLVVVGLRGRGAPRSETRSFQEVIAVGESGNETEMRVCAGRLAGFAAVMIEEKGT